MTNEKPIELMVVNQGSTVSISCEPQDGIDANQFKVIPPHPSESSENFGIQSTCAAFEIIGCPNCPLLRQKVDRDTNLPGELPGKPSVINVSDRVYYSLSLSPDVIYPFETDYPNPHQLEINNNSCQFNCPLLGEYLSTPPQIGDATESTPIVSPADIPCRRNVSFYPQDYPFLIVSPELNPTK
ncbi:MAG: hypothetical protein WC784_01645 [Candidatus Shapirobacteria bacterium]|jgi:hypothetical protein